MPNLVPPKDKDFIFSIFDDTDVSTLEYIRPIYDLLTDLNMYTTKSVWPIAYKGDSDYTGSHTLEDIPYALYMKDLQERGFEIAYHGPTMVTSVRDDAIRSFDVFHDVLGRYPRIYAPHAQNRENLYWGASRLSVPLLRRLYVFMTHEAGDYYQGHIEESPFYWGDLAFRHIEYVRNFTFNEVNMNRISCMLVYKEPSKPCVNAWFSSGDADNVEEFNRFLDERNQDKLQKEHGTCILSTHFGKGFVKNGKVHRRTEALLKELSRRNGWFVPVSLALDFIKRQQEAIVISYLQRFVLEVKWFVHTLRRKKTSLTYEKTEIAYLEKAINAGKNGNHKIIR